PNWTVLGTASGGTCLGQKRDSPPTIPPEHPCERKQICQVGWFPNPRISGGGARPRELTAEGYSWLRGSTHRAPRRAFVCARHGWHSRAIALKALRAHPSGSCELGSVIAAIPASCLAATAKTRSSTGRRSNKSAWLCHPCK